MPDSQFSGKRWSAGCLLAFAIGCAANMIAIMIGLRINITVIATILGILPGIGLFIASRRSPERSFRTGMLVGAIVIALTGGACAAIFTATQVKH